MKVKKTKILFVGSFKDKGSDGTVGGQMFACRSLINSDLKNDFVWILLDTTASTNKNRSFTERIYRSVVRFVKYLISIIRSNPEIVLLFSSSGFSFFEKGSMALLAKFFRKKVVFAPRSGFILDDINQSYFKRIFIRFVFQNVDKVVCQGESWQKFYYEFSGGNLNKFVVIHNWIDANKSVQKIDKHKSNRGNSRPTILFIGWINKNKGIYDLIDALKLIEKLEFKVIIGGDGIEMDNAINYVKKLGISNKIKFVGWVTGEDKYQLLANSDIFVLPSYREGYPNSLMEAMIANLAVVASNVGGVPDLIENRNNGVIVEPGNKFEISEALKLLIKDVPFRVKIASNARDRILHNNNISVGVEKFNSIFNSLN